MSKERLKCGVAEILCAQRDEKGRFKKGNSISSKYRAEYARRLIEYFRAPILKTEYKETYYPDGEIKSSEPVMVLTREFPTFGMFAMSIGISLKTLEAWAGLVNGGCGRREEFAHAYELAKDWQKGMIESCALTGHLNSNIAKFILTNNFGMKDEVMSTVQVVGMDDKDRELLIRVEHRLEETEQHADEADESGA